MRGILLFCVAALLPLLILAQAGANDPTFNTFDDDHFGIGGGFNGSPIWCSALQPDQKILVGGNFTAYNGTTRIRIARLNTDGSLDTTFNPGTGFNFTVSTISIQTDGKIIVGGDFTEFNGTSRIRVARLNSDGSLDNTFNSLSYFNNNVSTTAIQADGKIIVGGLFTFSYGNGNEATRLVRLNTDGTPDITYHSPGAGSEVSTVSIQADGKAIVAGRFTLIGMNDPQSRIMRLDTDGHLDTTFHIGSGFNEDVYTTTLQSDGKILVAGIFTMYNGTSMNRIIRLNTNGSVDTSFNSGAGFSGGPWSISMQVDEKIIVGGNFTMFNGNAVPRVVRLNSNGTHDLSFNAVSVPSTGSLFTTLIQSDQKVIVSGSLRLNTDGSKDTTFNPFPGANNWIYATAIQADQKILIGGRFQRFNGSDRIRIARLNTDGTLDFSFNPGLGFSSDVLAITVQPDGKILVGGDFTTYNGTARNRIIRLNPDGTIDLTFNPGTGCNSPVNSISIQSDGKIILAGEFTNFNGTSRNRIARLNTNGSLDLTFTSGVGFNGSSEYVTSTVVQTDGKIVVGGDFTTFNGTAVKRITRLNTNGTLDATFNPGGDGFNDEVKSLAIQTDGKIIVGGYFTSFNGTTNSRLVRLNANGGLDATFNPGTGFSVNASVWSILLQSDGKIIVGGGFTTFDGVARNCILRLNSNGSLDQDFDPGTGYSGFVTSNVIQADGKIVSGGNFTSFNGIRRNRVGRLLITCPSISPSATVTHVSCAGGSDGAIHLTPTGGTIPYSFDWGNGVTSEDRTGLADGTYSVTISDANGCATIFNATITIPVSTISITTSITQVSCFGGSTGEIDITPSGGTSSYTFDWGDGVTTEDRIGLPVGSYSVSITDANGCAIFHTTVTQPASALDASASTTNLNCFGDSNGEVDLTPIGGTSPYTFDWGGGVITEDRTGLTSGVYSVTITDSNGCVKTLSPSVTEPAEIVSSFATAACYSYTWNGQTYTTSNAYTQVLSAVNGCDSTVTLNLIINNATSASIAETACNSYTLNGQTYTSSGTYVQHLTNVAGCDSTLTLNLTITNPTANSIAQTACDSYTLNGQTYTSSGTYIQQLTNAVGCDSILTLNLTITSSTTSSIAQTACDSYTLNGQTYTASGIYLQNLTNAAGCDSTLTLNLTINTSPTMTVINNNDATITSSSADTYQWLDCSTGNAIAGATSQTFLVTVNGSYAVVGTSNAGCSDTSNCVTIDYMGLQEQSFMNITLVPNPTQDLVSIQFDGSHIILVIFDSQGKSLMSQSINSGQQVSLVNFADGIYFFEFTTSKGLVIKKIIKN